MRKSLICGIPALKNSSFGNQQGWSVKFASSISSKAIGPLPSLYWNRHRVYFSIFLLLSCSRCQIVLSPLLQHNIFKAVMKYLLPTLRAITVVYNPMYCRFLLHHKLTVHNSKKLFRIFPPRMFVDMFTSKIYRILKK